MSKKPEYIPIITRNLSVRVKVSDVLAVERSNRKVKVITNSGEYEMYGKMDEISYYLDERFYPCMAGCIINLEQIESMEKMAIRFFSGYNLIVGRDSFVRARQVYNAYIRKPGFNN